MRESAGGGAEERADVVHQMRGAVRLLDDPPKDECNGRPFEDRGKLHCRLPGSADISIFSSIPIILARNPAWMGSKPARPRALLSYLLQYARNTTRYAYAWIRVCRPAGEYAAACGVLEGTTPASTGRSAGQPVLWRIIPAVHTCVRTFRFLDVPRSDNIPPCRACLGHGDA